ncbi:MAG: hypothetical protein NTV32_05545 [Gammaproteobacteria bacterium]|nr:hypothetical protein [Gammaproteobacteria bacterium]
MQAQFSEGIPGADECPAIELMRPEQHILLNSPVTPGSWSAYLPSFSSIGNGLAQGAISCLSQTLIKGIAGENKNLEKALSAVFATVMTASTLYLTGGLSTIPVILGGLNILINHLDIDEKYKSAIPFVGILMLQAYAEKDFTLLKNAFTLLAEMGISRSMNYVGKTSMGGVIGAFSASKTVAQTTEQGCLI